MSKPRPHKEDEIATIFKAAPVPLVISRVADGKVLYANDALAAVTGLTAEELVGRQTPNFYADPRDREVIVAEIERAGRVINREVRMLDGHGNERWGLLSAVATEFRGEMVLVSGISDVTKRKQAEQALSDSERRYRNLVENANDIIYTIVDEKMTYVSPNWTNILGHEVSEIEGKPFAPLVHPDDLGRCYEFLQKVLETGERQGGIEYRVQHKDGSWRWHTSNAAPLKDEQGNVEAFIGIARDITEKKMVQLELERALQELRETQVQLVQSERLAGMVKLVAGVAHEMNSPVGALSSMQSTLDAAVKKLETEVSHLASGNPEQDRRLGVALAATMQANRVIGEGSERIKEILGRLRMFVRLDEADKKLTDVHEGLESVLTVLEPDPNRKIEIVRDYGDLEPLVCYPAKLNQAFFNILTNASQAIESEGRITITTRQDDSETRVSIGDTGKGIPESALERVFEPSFTVKGSRVRAGFGLAIALQIAKEHHGRIDVTSRVGEGSVFTMVLPRD